MEGYLSKEGHLFKTWKKRFFQLEGTDLKYFDDENKRKLKGRYVIDVEAKCNSVEDHKGKKYMFALQAKGDNHSDIILLSAPSLLEKERWVQEINKVISKIRSDLDVLHRQTIRMKSGEKEVAMSGDASSAGRSGGGEGETEGSACSEGKGR